MFKTTLTIPNVVLNILTSEKYFSVEKRKDIFSIEEQIY